MKVNEAHEMARILVMSDILDVYRACTHLHMLPPANWSAVDAARAIADLRERILRSPELYPLDAVAWDFLGQGRPP